MQNFSDKAKLLIEAIPYILKYRKKIVVIKYGGNAMINEELKQSVMSDIALLTLLGIKIVLIHGGGPDINAALKKTTIESKFINGLRYTDEETLDVVIRSLAGRVNKDLVTLLHKAGGNAIGLSGIDGNIISAKKMQSSEDLGYVGSIENVNCDAILSVLNSGYIPVIATIASDNDGNIYNINADTAAAAIAGSLKAENFILMSNIAGILEDLDDENSIIPQISIDDIAKLKDSGVILGGMLPKVDCCIDAIDSGVQQALILDGRLKHSILIEILSDNPIGTLIKKEVQGQ